MIPKNKMLFVLLKAVIFSSLSASDSDEYIPMDIADDCEQLTQLRQFDPTIDDLDAFFESLQDDERSTDFTQKMEVLGRKGNVIASEELNIPLENICK